MPSNSPKFSPKKTVLSDAEWHHEYYVLIHLMRGGFFFFHFSLSHINTFSLHKMNVRRVLKRRFSSLPPLFKPSPFTGCLLTPEEPWSSAQLNAPRVDREHANSKMRPVLFFFSFFFFFAVATHNKEHERDLYTFASTLITRGTWPAHTHTPAIKTSTPPPTNAHTDAFKGKYPHRDPAPVCTSRMPLGFIQKGQEKYEEEKYPTGGRPTGESCVCNQMDSVHTSHLSLPAINQQSGYWKTLRQRRTRCDPIGCGFVRKATSVALVVAWAYARINFLKSMAMK